jgi:hypothetical protein
LVPKSSATAAGESPWANQNNGGSVSGGQRRWAAGRVAAHLVHDKELLHAIHLDVGGEEHRLLGVLLCEPMRGAGR